MALPMVSSEKGIFFGVFQLRVASFRVAGAALRDIPTCFMTCQKLFCVAGAILLPRFQKMRCIFRRKRNTLETSDVILRGGRRNTFVVSCCVFLQIALSGLRDVVTLTTPHSTLYIPHFTLHTLHSTISIPIFTLYTLHSTLSTLH